MHGGDSVRLSALGAAVEHRHQRLDAASFDGRILPARRAAQRAQRARRSLLRLLAAATAELRHKGGHDARLNERYQLGGLLCQPAQDVDGHLPHRLAAGFGELHQAVSGTGSAHGCLSSIVRDKLVDDRRRVLLCVRTALSGEQVDQHGKTLRDRSTPLCAVARESAKRGACGLHDGARDGVVGKRLPQAGLEDLDPARLDDLLWVGLLQYQQRRHRVLGSRLRRLGESYQRKHHVLPDERRLWPGRARTGHPPKCKRGRRLWRLGRGGEHLLPTASCGRRLELRLRRCLRPAPAACRGDNRHDLLRVGHGVGLAVGAAAEDVPECVVAGALLASVGQSARRGVGDNWQDEAHEGRDPALLGHQLAVLLVLGDKRADGARGGELREEQRR